MTASAERVRAARPKGDDARGSAQEGDFERLHEMVDSIEKLFRGKRDAVELTIIALLAQGHVLFEDVPGVGKTTLARTVAQALGCTFKRIQFTSDLLPADIVGVTIYNRNESRFEFKPGPIFANLVLADEINRTTPRAQSALLEAMNAGQVTVDNVTHPLPPPFMVLATQNPLEFAGTYPLPESQLDRFTLRVTIGYPEGGVERDIIRSLGVRDVAHTIAPVLLADEVHQVQQRVTQVTVSEPVLDYIQALVGRTRNNAYFSLGVSTRGAIAFYRAAQARAYLHGRDYVLPDDVKALFAPVVGHRVMLKGHHEGQAERRAEVETVLGEMLETTPVPL